MFNDNVKIMNNYINYKSLLIQILVQNYLEHEYKTQDVFIYPELINDIDIFSTDLTKHQNLLNERGVIDYKLTIRAFLDEINNEDYVQPCEVKSSAKCLEPERVRGEKTNLCNVQYLNQILKKIRYPTNTKLLLILVPNEFNIDKSNIMDVNKFSRLKDEILNHDKRYEIFNALINDANLINQDINSALISILARLRKGNLKTCYKSNITNEEYETLVNNFKKIEIKILTFEDLEKYPISSEYIHSLLSNFAYDK